MAHFQEGIHLAVTTFSRSYLPLMQYQGRFRISGLSDCSYDRSFVAHVPFIVMHVSQSVPSRSARLGISVLVSYGRREIRAFSLSFCDNCSLQWKAATELVALVVIFVGVSTIAQPVHHNFVRSSLTCEPICIDIFSEVLFSWVDPQWPLCSFVYASIMTEWDLPIPLGCLLSWSSGLFQSWPGIVKSSLIHMFLHASAVV